MADPGMAGSPCSPVVEVEKAAKGAMALPILPFVQPTRLLPPSCA
ncbi:hypothetical protein OMR58_02905 [Erwinia sp. INIA-01]|nr:MULTISPECIES: hypothetical protein [unclassified Erwinia]MCW1873395.1 hypothetical protein [Erwinia sp. INIA01]